MKFSQVFPFIAPVAALIAPSLILAAPEAKPVAEEKPEQAPHSLFDGKSLSGWMSADGGEAKWICEDGTLARRDKVGDIWTKERFGDFVLELEFLTTGNSGVFIRTDNPKDCVQTGIEIQVEIPSDPTKNSVGSIYDLQAATKCNAKKGEWNTLKITCLGSKITVEMNGETINSIDLDQWTEAGKNPDGSKNKYKRAVATWKREGHIGFQDHGHNVAYRNISLTPLKAAEDEAKQGEKSQP